MFKITEKGQFEATVRRQKTNMPGLYGLIRSKSLAPVIGKKVKVTIEVIEQVSEGNPSVIESEIKD